MRRFRCILKLLLLSRRIVGTYVVDKVRNDKLVKATDEHKYKERRVEEKEGDSIF